MKSLHISVAPEVIGHIGALNITNSLVTSLIVMFFLVILSLKIKENKSSKKNTPFLLAEFIIEKFYMFFKNIAGEKIEIIFPLLMTFFLFIITANWIEVLPGFLNSFYVQTPEGTLSLFRSPSSDLSTTLALGTISVIFTQGISIWILGPWQFILKIIDVRKPIRAFTGILELMSEFSKIFSFAFRLFGNIFAGGVLLLVIGFLAPYIIPLPFMVLEIFVGFIQALIFSLLSLMFIKAALSGHHN